MKLAEQHCRPQFGPAMETQAAAAAAAGGLVGWQVRAGALEKTFEFDSYARTIEFVVAVARLAEREDHHPDMHVGWRRCTLRWSTHSAGGLTPNDFICAAQVDALRP